MQMAEVGSFTIEFFLHVPGERREYFLRSFQTSGAQIEELSLCRFRIVCGTSRQVDDIGVTLFHTHFDRVGRIVCATGSVRLEASAYHHPRTRAERKGRP